MSLRTNYDLKSDCTHAIADFLCDWLLLLDARVLDQSLGSEGNISENNLPLAFLKTIYLSCHVSFIRMPSFQIDLCIRYDVPTSQADDCVLVGAQEVYNYFRGSGKAAQLKREAAAGAFRASI